MLVENPLLRKKLDLVALR